MDETSVEGTGCCRILCFCNSDSEHDNSRLQKRISHQIDKQLEKERKVYQRTSRMWLLGTTESGKSTIVNQMRILYTNGFTHMEKQQKIKEIKNNIRNAILTILGAMLTLSRPVQLQHPENQKRMDWIQNYASCPNFDYPPEFYEHVEVLWKDLGVQIAYERSNEYHLMDNVKYFLDQVNFIKQPDYTPTEQDILRCRDLSEGINEAHFQVEEVNFYFWTHGRQKSQRMKWAGIRDRYLTAIIFVTASSSYDIDPDEDRSLRESLCMFKSIWNNTFALRNTSIILFLNKQDLLEEKILAGKYKLEDYFAEFKTYQSPVDGANDVGEVIRAMYFIRDKFLCITSGTGEVRKYCYPHFTCAVDTENMKHVFTDCQEGIQRIHQMQHKLL